MKTAVIIPARYASSRLPGKPLLRQTGKYLIQHVYERACQARNVHEVIVATDDSRIMAAVESFGGRAVMTSSDHASGTDRVAEVAHDLDADVIVNLQGDEPLIEPSALELLATLLEHNTEAATATLAVPLTSMERWQNPNCTKVVCDDRGRALYFSRSPSLTCETAGRILRQSRRGSCSTWGCMLIAAHSCFGWRRRSRRRLSSWKSSNSCASSPSAGPSRSASSLTPPPASIRMRIIRNSCESIVG